MSAGNPPETRDATGAYPSRAVTVFVLLLVIGAVGTQTRESLPRMALSQIEQASEREARTDAEDAPPVAAPRAQTVARATGRQIVETRFRLDDWWPAPRGPDRRG